MMTVNVVLNDHDVRIIDALVRSGHYQNINEVLRDGLRPTPLPFASGRMAGMG